MTFHGVKEAGVADTAKRVGRFLFDEKAMPYHLSEVNTPQAGFFNRLVGKTENGVFDPNALGRFLGMSVEGPSTPVTRIGPPGSPFLPVQQGYGKGFGNWMKTVGHTLGEGLRERVFGSPLAVDRQLRERGYLGMARDMYMPKGNPIGTAIGLAGPAMSALNIYRQGPAHRGANIGSTIAGLAAAPVTSRLGIPGAVLIQQPIQQVGRWLGSKFDKPQPQPPQLPSPAGPPKTAALVGPVVEAAKKHPASAALLAAAAIHGGRKLLAHGAGSAPTPQSGPSPLVFHPVEEQ